MYTIDQVSDTLIQQARDHGLTDISNLKLQKLLYYAQAWNLAFYSQPLFGTDIQAWVHGPVVPEVFRRFRGFGWKPIDSLVCAHWDTKLSAHLRSILTAYGGLNATQLERLSHSEDPWKIARNGIPADVSCTNVIKHADMRNFYLRMYLGSQKAT